MSTRKLMSASFANLLIPISGLLVSPFLSRELGPDGRGLYAALTLPIVVCGWIGTFGLQDALSFHLRKGLLASRQAARVSLIAVVPLGLLGLALLGVLGAVVFAADQPHYTMFLTLSLLAPLHILANLFIGALTGASDIRGVNMVKVVPALIRTVVVIFACLAFDLSAYWASLLFLLSVIAGVVIGLARLRVSPGADDSSDEDTTDTGDREPDGIPTRSIVAYSLTCLPGVLAAISSARLDQIIGLPVIGARELGYYAVAVSVAEIPMVIATAARTVLMGRSATADPQEATQIARLAVFVSVIACGLLAVTAAVAVPIVFGRAFAPSVLPTVILCAGTVLYTGMLIFSAVLLVNDRPGWSSASLVSGSVSGLVLLFVLAPLGAVGAAIASVVGYGVSLVVAALLVRRTDGPSLRMLTVPYPEDVRLIAGKVQQLTTSGPLAPAVGWLRRVGPGTVGAALLITLAWFRVLGPHLLAVTTGGRPEFNSRTESPAEVVDLAGDVLSLAFLGVALAMIGYGLWRRPRPTQKRWLPAVLAPLAGIALAGLLAGDRPGLVTLALPIAAVAIWVLPPRPAVLGVFGLVGGVTAVVSVLLAAIRPDLGLLSGEDSGAKEGFLGGLLTGPFPHSNVLGISLTLAVPFILAIASRSIRWPVLAVTLFAIYWTGSRTNQLAIVVVVVSYLTIRLLLLRRPRLLPWLLAVPAIGALGLTIVVPLSTSNPAAFTDRGRIWSALLNGWEQRPVWGWGTVYFDRPEIADELGGNFNHGHNVMVQLLIVGGLVSALLFGLLCLAAWHRAVRLLNGGAYSAVLFLIALGMLSWLEASHVATTLAGYATWLPLMMIMRLGDHPPAETAADAADKRPSQDFDRSQDTEPGPAGLIPRSATPTGTGGDRWLSQAEHRQPVRSAGAGVYLSHSYPDSDGNADQAVAAGPDSGIPDRYRPDSGPARSAGTTLETEKPARLASEQ
ncbi:O-antigen ligase family protein [Micromonospora sp. NBC_01813]|uniref:O-antigen ligase family protein n=1 Tax=Micromonospora sp. NBC_01813 TaxID=2975988 RepID=UPI002DDBDC51|nr:O-antigen ligase family protein [Micromonospora sp. NBC_01813]WSA10307.1 O-antigen ligase family protein [Micromonospora sp. NBC_01813]